LRASSRASRREVPYTAGDADASSTTEGKKQVTHTVSSGQSLSYIALQYGVTVSNIRIWNRLSSNMIHPNQKLAVWVKETPKAASTTATTPPAKTATKTTTTTVTPSANAKYHTVKSGDTLWDIAQKYQGLTVEKIRKLNNMNSRSMLSPGQKLVISN
jgi:membrane-bound lytic murein transglycosylase D